MIAVDTNILVRLLTLDDQQQAAASQHLFSMENEIFIPETVVQECEWVLRFSYEFSPARILSAFRNLFGLQNVRLRDPRLMSAALSYYEGGMDFSDALHLAASAHCQEFRTFDREFVRQAVRAGTTTPVKET